MRPYYEEPGITIYCGDCREILPELERVDVVITDPPYGVKGDLNSKTARRYPWSVSGQRKKNAYASMEDTVQYIADVVAPAFAQALDVVGRAILTPGNRCLTFYPPPDSFGCFWQPASIGLQRWGRADSQPIFYYGSLPYPARDIPGRNLSFVLTESPQNWGHPCEKPIRCWTKLVALGSLDGETILDPFMGSGTTLVAAKNLGRKAIGIEIEEKYCEIAVKRLAQSVLPFAVGK